MNFSNLTEMVRQGDMSLAGLRYLIQCRTECEMLDYKEALHIDNDYELCEFARDVLAFKNIGGGYIVVGVVDKTWEPRGLGQPLPYDSKMLKDKIRKATGLDLDIFVVHHNVHFGKSECTFALIYIKSTKKRSKLRVPTVASKDFSVTSRHGIRAGDIYIRKGDETKRVTSAEELENVLDEIAEKDSQEEISQKQLTEYAVCEGLYRILDKGYDQFIGRQTYKKELLSAIQSDPRVWIINVHGPGGVGKSSLINWAVYELYQQKVFESIIHLTAKETMLTETGIRSAVRNLYSVEDLLDSVLSTFEESLEISTEKKVEKAHEYLGAFKVLLILDNMETINDSRILEFIQKIPYGSTSKVLITSRTKTGGWELPFPIKELSLDETREFIRIKADERGIEFPMDEDVVAKVQQYSGGLPLAIQWIIGQFKLTNSVDEIFKKSIGTNSPILEFSFRNIWNLLSADAKRLLAIFPIFGGAPSIKEISIASNKSVEAIEVSMNELIDCTLVYSLPNVNGKILYSALPITLSFAKNQLSTMGSYEIECQQRLQKYNSQILLHDSEVKSFKAFFDRFHVTSENEKKSIILIKRAKSDFSIQSSKTADQFIKEASELAPESVLSKILIAEYFLEQQKISFAVEYIKEAEKQVTKTVGKFLYATMVRIYDAIRDRTSKLESLRKELSYDTSDNIVKHQIGVELSRQGEYNEAYRVFSEIVTEEMKISPPRDTLILALKTRIINAKRLDKSDAVKSDKSLLIELIQKYPYFYNLVQNIDLED